MREYKRQFSCSRCGHDEGPEVIRTYATKTMFRRWIPCRCERDLQFAQEEFVLHRQHYYDVGILDEDGAVEWHDIACKSDDEVESISDATHCESCVLDAVRNENLIEAEEVEAIEAEADLECIVRCPKCLLRLGTKDVPETEKE